MQFSVSAGLLALASVVAAQRPMNMSICDYYTGALLMNNTPANQYKVLNLIVNTAVIGNYTTPNMNAVPGILTPGMYNGTMVNLAPYFDGGLKSTNRGMPVALNFLDGGGATPVENGTVAAMGSNQYTLLTHLYSYFGALLGCSGYGTDDFPAYTGQNSQGRVHQYMDLDANQVGYFIQQVGLSAASFGVTSDDVQAVGMSLSKVFNYKCSPPATVIPMTNAYTQSICQDDSCPLDANATCSAYPDNGASMEPMVANATLAMGEGTNSTSSMSGSSTPSGSSMPSGTSSMSGSMTSATAGATNAAAKAQFAGLGAAAAGGIALAFAL